MLQNGGDGGGMLSDRISGRIEKTFEV